MKNLIFLSLLIVSFFSTKAQNPLDSFYISGTSWKEYYVFSAGQRTGSTSVYTHYLDTDTIINGKTYKLLKYYQDTYTYETWGSPSVVTVQKDTSIKSLMGGIRTDGNKVYLINLRSDTMKSPPLIPLQETIIYDFDVKVGDTISWKPYNNVVIDIDTVQLSSGKFVKRFFFSKDATFQDFWVYGVSSNMGFMTGSYDQNFPKVGIQKTYTVCYNGQDEFKFYYGSRLDSNTVTHCYLVFPTSIAEVSNDQKGITLYPNPVLGSTFTLQLNSDVTAVRVYDIRGRVLSTTTNLKKGTHQISVLDAAGIYIIQVIGENGAVSYSRFEKL